MKKRVMLSLISAAITAAVATDVQAEQLAADAREPLLVAEATSTPRSLHAMRLPNDEVAPEIAEVANAILEAPRSLEGWRQLDAAAKAIDDRKREPANSDEVGQLRKLSNLIESRRRDIKKAVQDEIVSSYTKNGRDVNEATNALLEAALEAFSDAEWHEETAHLVHRRILDFFFEKPSRTASEIRSGDDQASLIIYSSAWELGLGPEDIPSEIAEAIVEEQAEQSYYRAESHYGFDMRSPLEEREFLQIKDVHRWIALLRNNILVSSVSYEWGTDHMIKMEVAALAQAMTENAEGMYSEFFESLKGDPMGSHPVDFMIRFMREDGGYLLPEPWVRDYASGPRVDYFIKLMETHKLEEGYMFPRWSSLGHPKVDVAISEAAVEAATSFAKYLAGNMDRVVASVDFADWGYASVVTVLKDLAADKEGISERLLRLSQLDAGIGRHMESAFDGFHRKMAEKACEASLEEANLSPKDRGRLILSSGGEPEELWLFVCKTAARDVPVRGYQPPGWFGREHELHLTLDGEDVVLTLIEEEVAGTDMLVPTSISNGNTQIEMTRHSWQDSVDELFGSLAAVRL